MRMAFGLAGLLVTVAIMVYVWSFYTQGVSNSAAQVRPAAEQIAGVESGDLVGHVSDHFKLAETAGPDGKVRSIAVTQIDAGSSMQTYYGLRPGDQIIEVGEMKVHEMDSGLAIALVKEAYQRKQTLAVMRDGRRLDLPGPKNAPVPYVQPAQPQPMSVAPAPAADPAAPAPQPAQPKKNPFQRQLDMVRPPTER